MKAKLGATEHKMQASLFSSQREHKSFRELTEVAWSTVSGWCLDGPTTLVDALSLYKIRLKVYCCGLQP